MNRPVHFSKRKRNRTTMLSTKRAPRIKASSIALVFFFNYELAAGKQLGNSSRFCLAGVIESEAIGWKSNFPSSLLDFLSPKGTLSTKVRSSVSFPSFSFPFPKQTSIGRFLFSRCVLRVSRIIIEGDSETRIADTASTKGTLYSSVS